MDSSRVQQGWRPWEKEAWGLMKGNRLEVREHVARSLVRGQFPLFTKPVALFDTRRVESSIFAPAEADAMAG